MDEVLRPFTFEFFRNGLAVALVTGALCGALGSFVVVRRASALGHGLSHAVFGGFAAATVANVNVVLGAGVWGVLAALLIGRVARREGLATDSAIGVVTTASFAGGLALLQAFDRSRRNAEAILFGNVLAVDMAGVITAALVTVAVIATVAACYRPLVFTSFDPDVAEVSGVRVARYDALLMALLAVSLLAAMTVLGATLVAAAVVIPAATARLLTSSFSRLLVLALGLGALGGAAGMVASYHLDIASGPTIVLAHTVLFGAASLRSHAA